MEYHITIICNVFRMSLSARPKTTSIILLTILMCYMINLKMYYKFM